MTKTAVSGRKNLYIIGAVFVMLMAYVLVLHPGKVAAACATQDTSRGQVTSSFTVPTNGTYRVWSRIQAPNTTNNSYTLEIDGSTCGVVVGDSAIAANTWTWVDYQSGTASNKVNVTLTAGTHTMTMIGREDNVELDRVIFTTDTSCVPTGTGDNCANPPDTTNPTVSLTSPTAGSTVKDTITVQATAADDVSLSKVEFYVDGTLKATDASSAYSYSFDTKTVSNGTHSIVAKAYDSSNNTASSTVSVTVNNPAVCATGSSTLPTTPGSLAKTSSTYTSITLSWSASTPSPGCTTSGYKVFRGGTQVGTVTTGTSYTDSGLSAGTSYNYNIQAYDSGPNNSAQSALASFSTVADNVAPTIPSNFSATAGSAASVSLSWSASTDNPNPGGVGVDGYNIYRNGATTPTYTVNSASTLTYSDTNVSSSTKYTYIITAIDKADNESAPSAGVSATTAAPTCSGNPSVPTALHGTSQTLSSVTIAWTASSASAGCTLSGYHVYRGGTYVGDATGTTYTSSSLTANTSYSFTVAAFDTSGHNSAQTSAVSVATLADTTVPGVPGGVTASPVSSTQVTVAWTAATDNVGVTNYRIYRGGTLIATVGSTARTYSDTTLTANTNYSYQVSALDTVGNESAKVNATPTPVHTPATVDTTTPTTPTTPAVPVVAAQSATVTWTASTDNVAVAGYHVYINGVYGADSTTTSFAVQCLAPNVQYTFTIKAFDTAGNVSSAGTVKATTLNGGLQGDLDCNTAVNSGDLFTLLRNWQQTAVLPINGDLNGDAKVDSNDLFSLLRNWGKTI